MIVLGSPSITSLWAVNALAHQAPNSSSASINDSKDFD